MERYGSLYAEACLRALTEQLIGVLGLRANLTVCELMCDGAPIIRAVAPTLVHGTVIAADQDPQLTAAAAAEIERHSTCSARTAATDGTSVDLADASCDRVASMLTLGFGDPAALLAEARRVLRPEGGIACVMWDPSAPPAHETALDNTLRNVTGSGSPFLRRVMAPLPELTAFEVTTVRDVVRFNGIDHYWAAMVAQRPIAAEIAPLGAEATRSMQDDIAAALRSSTTADGSMRIPVTALVIRF